MASYPTREESSYWDFDAVCETIQKAPRKIISGSYLFQIQGHCDPLVLRPVLKAGALPPAGGAINSVRDGVPFVMVRGVRIAHSTLRGAHLHVFDKLAVDLRTGRAARRVNSDRGARRQIEDGREEANVVTIVTVFGLWK